jgi:hypothetical protein
MNFIIIVIVSVASTVLGHPFQQSDLTFELASRDNRVEVPAKHPCSCQLVVLSVYDDHYQLTLRSEEGGHTHFRVKIESSQSCLIARPDPANTAVFEIASTAYNGYEITERFLIDFYSPVT